MKKNKLILLILAIIPFISIAQIENKGAVLSSGATLSEGNNYENIAIIGQPFIQNAVYFDNYNYSVGFIFDWLSTTTNINDITDENSIVIYPNPTTGIINLSLRQTNISKNTLRIINQLGKLILLEKVESNSFSIDLSSIEKGIYFLVIQNTKDKFVEKIVIE